MSQPESDLNSNQFADTLLENEKAYLKACKICHRTFNPTSLERHEKACEKLKKLNNRTVFNSFLQRAKETNGIPVINGKKEGKGEKERCKAKCKENENDFRIIKADKTSVLNNGTSRMKDYQQCPSCKRCFNDKAAERHIIWCQEQQTRLPKTPPSLEALERLKARVKYRAPLPMKRNLSAGNLRLVKSADSVRESSKLRTHSSPPMPTHQSLYTTKANNDQVKTTIQVRQKKNEKCTIFTTTNHDDNVPFTKQMEYESKEKKSVKFKEKFPVYNKERNKNLDMLAALKLRLTKLNTSDDFLDPSTLRCSENGNINIDSLKQYGFPAPIKDTKDSWSSDGELCYSTSSSSNSSLPSVGQAESYERRLPRFCYNCGTKYPIVSAKYCCECGARRFIFGSNDNQLIM